MNRKTISLLIFSLITIGIFSYGFKGDEKGQRRKVNQNDHYQYIAVNQIFMWVSNNGDGSHDPTTDANGFYWPGGKSATKSAIFEDGLIFAGKIGREIRMNGNTHRQGLQAGKILETGLPDDPTLDKYRVYKITKGWEGLPPGPEKDARQKDYEEWPIEDGAPYIDMDSSGTPTPGDLPRYEGDETLWYVANDMDPTRSTFTYGTLPMGLEFQTTIFAFKRTGALGDMVFKKYTIINKGKNTINDMILGYWSDTDLGDANDDFTGCDTVLSLGYTYNGDNSDAIYGTPPPAVGYDFFQGPIVSSANPTDSAKFLGRWRTTAFINGQEVTGIRNLPMTAFAFYINANAVYRDPTQGVASGSVEFYNYLQGLVWNGDPFIDPTTSPPQPVKFVLAGDPVAGTGWYEGPQGWPGGPAPDDRRHLMSSGPFTMTPGDTQEIVVGIIAAMEGVNNLSSVTALKIKDLAAQKAYDANFELTPAPDPPEVSVVPQENQVTLWWENNSESYQGSDPLLPDTINFNINGIAYQFGLTPQDKIYRFEGYRIWQFKDETGTDPVLLATYDLVNNVTEITDYIYEYLSINGSPVTVEPYISGFNSGLRRFVVITKDAYTNGPLHNGNPYYFAVTAYGYSKWSDPPYLENSPTIIEVRPGRPPIDLEEPYGSGDIVSATQTGGTGTGDIKIKVIDPAALTGDQYRITINGSLETNDLRYSLVNLTTGEQLFTDITSFDTDFDSKLVTDGFQIIVQNTGWDSIRAQQPATLPGNSMVRDVVEVMGPNGVPIDPPRSVYFKSNSTGAWMVKSVGQNPAMTLDPVDLRQNIDWTNSLGFNDYEIRFTPEGSQYYITGFSGARPPFLNNQLGAGKVPFEIWNVGGYNVAEPIETREYIKVWDAVLRDSMWTQNPETKDWEAIFSYESTTPYAEPLPQTSGAIASAQHRLGNLVISGALPEPGSVIKVVTFKPLSQGDEFTFTVQPPRLNQQAAAQNMNNISVFPNPYFGANSLERDKYQRFVRFTNLPNTVTVRIFSIGGTFIRRLEKADASQYLDWDLRNKDGLPVASGMYIAYLDMPGIGSKVMKLAVIMETQYIDRL